jgi:predicted DNA-binding antitoxin AbrB/MazE fold protein
VAEIITAVYENGVLRPTRPLRLRDRETVRLQIVPDKAELAENEAEAAIQRLVEAGLLTPPSGHPDVAPLSREERLALAERLGAAPGKPLSEIIIEEREGR